MLEYKRFMARDSHDEPLFILAVGVEDVGGVVKVGLRITDMGPGMAYEFKFPKEGGERTARMEYAERSVRNFLSNYNAARNYTALYYTLCDG